MRPPNARDWPEPSGRPRRHARHPPLRPGAAGGGAGGEPGGGQIYRRLAATRPDAFLPDLALSLSNIGAMLSDLGRRKRRWRRARRRSRSAGGSRRRGPTPSSPTSPASLNNLGLDLSDLGRREEALAASQEAVEIRRRLAAARPDAFLPDLARSLSALSDAFAALDGKRRRRSRGGGAGHPGAVRRAISASLRAARRGRLRRARKHSEAAGMQPDAALLERVAQAIARGQPGS